jgi:PAS domain-containing protein
MGGGKGDDHQNDSVSIKALRSGGWLRGNDPGESRASMQQDLRKQIKEATAKSGNEKLDFLALLKLIDEHYDKMEATITQSFTQSLATSTTTPIEVIFDSVTDALISVNSKGIIRNCNKVCSRYFGRTKDQLIGSPLASIVPAAANQPIAEFLKPFMSSLEDTHVEFNGGEVDPRAPTASILSQRSIQAAWMSAVTLCSSSVFAMLPAGKWPKKR